MDNEVFSSIVSLHTKIDELTKAVNSQPCAVNNNRINNIEKVVFGAVKIILVAFAIGVVTLVVNSGGNPHKQAVAKQNINLPKPTK